MSKNVYEMVTDRIIEQLENGVIPWEKPWTGVRDGVIDGLICPKTTELYCPNLAQIYVRQSYGILSV